MRRRSLTLTLLAFLAVQPVQAQNWIGRYVSERKEREREQQRRATSLKEEMERRARRDLAREEEHNATQPTSAELAESNAPTAAAASETPEPEVRRALPVNPEAAIVPPGSRLEAVQPAVVQPVETLQPQEPAQARPVETRPQESSRYRIERLDRSEQRNLRQREAEERRRAREGAGLTPFFNEEETRTTAAPEPPAPVETVRTPVEAPAEAPLQAPVEVRRAERAPVPPPAPEAPGTPGTPAVEPQERGVVSAPAAEERGGGATGIHNPPGAQPSSESGESTPGAPASRTAQTEESGEEGEGEVAHRAEPPKETTPEDAIGTYSSKELDPDTTEIRLSPDATAVPADITQIQHANRYYAAKEYSLAATEYERYLTLYPHGSERASAFFRLAECYRRMGSFNAARKNYEALIYTVQVGEFIGPASYRLAEICFNEEDYSGAASFFRKASVWVKDPAIILSAKFYAARSLEKLRFTSDAILAYEDILREQGENPFREASQLALVQLLNNAGRRSQALKLLDTLRRETEKPAIKAEATVRIGLILLDQKLNDRAAAELQAALAMPEVGGWKEVAEIGLLRLRYNEGKYKDVLSLYEASSKEFSTGVEPEVWLIIANSYRQLDQFAKAREFYDLILEKAPNTPYAKDAEYERLVALYGADAKELLPEIDAYLERNPEESDRRDQLTLMKAESFYKTKRYGIAAQLYESLEGADLPPAMKAEALFKRGWSYAQVGENAAAIESFSAFLAGNRNHKLSVTALAQRAYCYEQVKNYSAALNDFNALLEQYPHAKEREFALQRKALILGQQDENRAMVETFNKLLKEYPKSKAAGQAHYWVGLTAFQVKNYKEAIGPLRAAREKDKEFADRSTALLLASLRYMEDRDELAKEVDTAGESTKVVPEIYRWLAKEYLKGKQPEQAEKYLTRLVALPEEENPTPVDGDWLDLGLARTQLGKWKEGEAAIEDYLKRVTQPGPRANGFLALGQAQLGAGEYEQALKSANSVLELQPEGRLNALGRMLSGDIAVAQGEHLAGAKHFMGVALVFEDPVITPQALEKAHLAYEKAGDKEQAAKVFNTLRSRFPEYKVGMLR